jgi:hypothetical protein
MHSLTFATMVIPGQTEPEAVLLARSLRTQGGALAGQPVCVFYPETGTPLADATRAELAALDVRLEPVQVEPDTLRFPLAAKVFAAAAAEAQAESGLLVWMDSDTIIIQEPAEFLLPDGAALGYRPVHHILIGSRYDEPLDAFWSLIYARCDVPDAHVFPMQTVADGLRIRPYVNAGLLVVRPDRGLLQAWRDRFRTLYRLPEFAPFYKQNVRYAIFMHQAVLAGVMLACLEPGALCELSPRVNYPLNLHHEHLHQDRPDTLDALVTCRYDTYFDSPDWVDRLPAGMRLEAWIAEHTG